jgi:hypothetical protein
MSGCSSTASVPPLQREDIESPPKCHLSRFSAACKQRLATGCLGRESRGEQAKSLAAAVHGRRGRLSVNKIRAVQFLYEHVPDRIILAVCAVPLQCCVSALCISVGEDHGASGIVQ